MQVKIQYGGKKSFLLSSQNINYSNYNQKWFLPTDNS